MSEFEAGLAVSWYLELSDYQRQILCNMAGLPQYATSSWEKLSPSIRLALANAGLVVCELAARLALDLER
ncbi:MAG: hypothetical protein ACREJ2_11615 [Planctomycetota bacterium]